MHVLLSLRLRIKFLKIVFSIEPVGGYVGKATNIYNEIYGFDNGIHGQVNSIGVACSSLLT